MRTVKSKNLLIKQGTVYGVKSRLRMTDVGVQSNVVTSLKNTQNKRRKIVADAKLNNFSPSARHAILEFEDWQRRVFAKNAKKGWRFFQPDTVDKPTPRSAKEAWNGIYESEDRIVKDEKITNRIMLGLFLAFVVVLSIL
jgi:hypothetical protein